MPYTTSSPVVYARDNVTFRHCLVKVSLIKNWNYSVASFSEHFSLLKEDEESAHLLQNGSGGVGSSHNHSNCFMIKNKDNYAFDVRWDRMEKMENKVYDRASAIINRNREGEKNSIIVSPPPNLNTPMEQSKFLP